MSLITFYQDVLKQLDVFEDSEGFLKSKLNDEDEIYITRLKGKKIKLPTKVNLDNMFHPDENGKFIRSYLIFNPLSESAYEDGYSLELLLELIKKAMMTSLASLGELLLTAYNNPKLQHDLPLALQEFIGNAKDKSIKGMKSSGRAIDELMAEKWKRYIASFTTSIDKEMVTIVLARTKRIGDTNSYTREARLTSSIYKDLKDALGSESNTSINGVSLRPKDVKIFFDIINLFLGTPDENGLVKVGTQDTNSPGFIALMRLAKQILNPTAKYIKSLAIANPIYKEHMKEITLEDEDIDTAPVKYKKELTLIPTDNEINKGANVLNVKQGTNLNTRNLHSSVATAINKPAEALDYSENEPKTGAEMLLRRRYAQDEAMMMQQGGMYGMVGHMNKPMPKPIRPGMIGRLSPQYNSMEAQQQYMQERYNGMNTGYGYGMQQQVIGNNMGYSAGYGMNQGMNRGMGNMYQGTYGSYNTYSTGTGWGR